MAQSQLEIFGKQGSQNLADSDSDLSSDEADELEGNLLRFQPEVPDDEFKPLEPVEDFEQEIIRNCQLKSIISE